MSAKAFRIGTEPQIDEELATKFYVDNSSGGDGSWSQTSSAQGSGISNNRTIGFGRTTWSTNDGLTNACLLEDITFSLMCFTVGTNTRDELATIHFRTNAGALTQTITIPSTTTGFFQDITHTDDLVTGDSFNFFGNITGSGSCNTNAFAIKFTPT